MSIARRYIWREHLQRVAPDVVAVAALELVDADEKGVVHDADFAQDRGVAAELFSEESTFLGPELDALAARDPVQVLFQS